MKSNAMARLHISVVYPDMRLSIPCCTALLRLVEHLSPHNDVTVFANRLDPVAGDFRYVRISCPQRPRRPATSCSTWCRQAFSSFGRCSCTSALASSSPLIHTPSSRRSRPLRDAGSDWRQVPRALLLLHRSSIRLHARQTFDVVSLHDADLRQRSRVAGVADEEAAAVVPEAGQRLPDHQPASPVLATESPQRAIGQAQRERVRIAGRPSPTTRPR